MILDENLETVGLKLCFNNVTDFPHINGATKQGQGLGLLGPMPIPSSGAATLIYHGRDLAFMAALVAVFVSHKGPFDT